MGMLNSHRSGNVFEMIFLSRMQYFRKYYFKPLTKYGIFPYIKKKIWLHTKRKVKVLVSGMINAPKSWIAHTSENRFHFYVTCIIQGLLLKSKLYMV